MGLAKLKTALEGINARLRQHDGMKPHNNPHGPATEHYKSWVQDRDVMRAERDRLFGLVDAEEKLLANKPFAPVPPSNDPAKKEDLYPDDFGDTVPLEDGPTDHLAGARLQNRIAELESETRRLLDVLDRAGIRISSLGAEAKFYKADGSHEWLPLEEWTRQRKEWAKKVTPGG